MARVEPIYDPRLTMDSCVACGGGAFETLPDPRPGTSIASDLRIVEAPLAKVMCRACGLVVRPGAPPVDFTLASYSLYDHAPGQAVESARQQQYATWLSEILHPMTTLYEAGCGNGSLLLALLDINPSLKVLGIEPAPGAAEAARNAGLDVKTGSLAESTPADVADVAIAINVIEHVLDPLGFIADLARHGERVAICCPNGTEPNLELVFADHRWSFTPSHMSRLFANVGLEVLAQYPAPATMGDFFVTVGRPTRKRDAHIRYLNRWERLDSILLERIGSNSAYCFGAGEAAALLRAYAPASWQRIIACVVDQPTAKVFGETPIVPTSEVHQFETLVLGTHPRTHSFLAKRFETVAKTIVRWDDIIPA